MNFQTTAVFDFQMARSRPFPNKIEPVFTALLQHSPFECLYICHWIRVLIELFFLSRFDLQMRRKRTRNHPHPHPLKNKLHESKLVLYNHRHNHSNTSSQQLSLNPRLNRFPRGLLLNQQHNLWLWRGRHGWGTASKRRHKESCLVVR